MILWTPRFLQYPALGAYYDGVGGNDERRLALLFVVNLADVDFATFLRGSFENIFIGRERLRQIFFEC
jgi:hypothetical protein